MTYNVPCPHCKSLELVQIAHDDHLSFGTIFKYQCLHCGKIMNAEELSSYSNTNTHSDSDKAISMEDISKKLIGYDLCVPCDNAWGVSKFAVSENMLPQTLTIANCEKIKMHHKEMNIDFEFDTNKLENIDTIIINGYKYKKEKVD